MRRVSSVQMSWIRDPGSRPRPKQDVPEYTVRRIRGFRPAVEDGALHAEDRLNKKLLIHNVSKHFRVRGGRTLEALADVTLSIDDGEFVCLVGPSGCGKSTLLSIVAGLEHPTRGQVFADGRPVAGVSPSRILIFQEPALFPWLTVLGNIEFGLRFQDLTREDRRARAMDGLRLVGLEGFSDAFVHQLSGGMKQRAALARALVLDPELLLMDEPFAALDAQSRDMLHQEVLRVWERTGKTVVFVTHNVQEALRLADRVVVFSARPGRVLRQFRVAAARPRPVEQGALCEIGEEIRHELRVALTNLGKGGGIDARTAPADRFLPDAGCSLGTSL